MPEINTYTFNHREILELLIKEADIHTGEWMLQVNFGFSAGNFGPDENNLNPGAVVAVQHLAITKAIKGAPKALVADAAKINPAPST
jgi:hypothetical protein